MFVEGPYGKLTGARRTRRGVTLIAGGIGITPLRALLESLPGGPGDLTLIYRATTADQLVFRTELDTLAAHRGARVHYLVGSRRAGEPGRPMAGPSLDAATLARLVPDDRRAGRLPVRADGPDGRGPRRARRARGAAPARAPGAVRLLSPPSGDEGPGSHDALSGVREPRGQPINPKQTRGDPFMPKRGAIALGLTTLALVLLLNFQTPGTIATQEASARSGSSTGSGGERGRRGADVLAASGGTSSGGIDRRRTAATARPPARGRRRRRAPRSTPGMAPSRSR